KLLRVLQEGYLDKIGSKKTIKSNFRIICATNRDIDSLLDQNHFRLDLFYRINALSIRVPPLRERREDIPLLSNHFIREFNRKYDLQIKGIAEEAMQVFLSYTWPGNVRELKNEIGRACCFSKGEIIGLDCFSHRLLNRRRSRGIKIQDNFSRKEILNSAEKALILEALKKTGGNKAKASKLLGLSRTMLYKKIKALNIAL
ncbi:MAG: sigma-54-dependent Fis family transcriptional regulator, partial [Desulfobacteraceae bacterium]|nr:sigma-54-dependent Fis family transcriptional regulator [Desulfobacteraceae bacterium]